ncbi:MAG: DUF177 domain-containing protein [Nitrospira sp.]
MKMEIKVQDIPSEGLLLSCEEDPSLWGLEKKEVSIEGKIRVRLKAVRHNEDNVYIRGAIEAGIFSECGRCLIHYVEQVRSDFQIDYVPMPQIPLEEELILSREELEINYYEGDQIDINDEIRSQLFLTIPMRPLCKPDCLGLCPHCGENLNQKPCSCPAELPDARWAKLKNILNK